MIFPYQSSRLHTQLRAAVKNVDGATNLCVSGSIRLVDLGRSIARGTPHATGSPVFRLPRLAIAAENSLTVRSIEDHAHSARPAPPRRYGRFDYDDTQGGWSRRLLIDIHLNSGRSRSNDSPLEPNWPEQDDRQLFVGASSPGEPLCYPKPKCKVRWLITQFSLPGTRRRTAAASEPT